MQLSEQDQKDIDKELEKSTTENITKDHSLTTEIRPTLATAFRGVDIEGMEGVPAGLGIPYVRLVQPTSQHAENEKGDDAPVGSFLFSDTKLAVPELNFVLLGAKTVIAKFMREEKGEMKEVVTNKLRILGMTIDEDKLFTLSLSPTSFGAFGGVISQFKALQAKKSWQFVLSATSRKRENAKGKFSVIDFKIGEEIKGKNLTECEQKAREYVGALDQAITEEE